MKRIFLPAVASILLLVSCKENESTTTSKPVVIATWDSGKPVVDSAWTVLSLENGLALDAVEKGANSIENTINCCVGLGGNPDRDGFVTLDACIMDQHANCGSVAFLERVRNPISVARAVMEKTPHVMLVGEGAQKFAVENGFALEDGKLSSDAQKTYEEWLKTSEYKPKVNIEQTQGKVPQKLPDGSLNHDTMALLALDNSDNLSGACTTSGMGFKMRGRVGDSPIIGSGLFVDNAVGAATATGQGEEVIRTAGSHTVVELMRQGKSPMEACKLACQRIVDINPEKAKNFQVAFIALNKRGEYGAYSIQPGFSYAVKTADGETQVIPSESLFK